MPYKSRKVANKNCYRVYNRKTKKTFAKCSTKENAAKQIRLLRAIQNNKNFVPNGRKNQPNGRNQTRKVR